jgi:hypothetical protein
MTYSNANPDDGGRDSLRSIDLRHSYTTDIPRRLYCIMQLFHFKRVRIYESQMETILFYIRN